MRTDASVRSAVLIGLLAACTMAPQPPGRLVVHKGDPPTLCAVRATGGPMTCEAATGRFAGPPRPGHAELVIIEASDDAQGHKERLLRWTAPDAEAPALTPWAPQVRTPAWSADGERLAVTTSLGGVSTLFTLPVTYTPEPPALHDHPAGSFEPAWHPGGQRLAFASSRDGNAELYELPAAGGSPTRLTNHPGDDLQPTFSSAGALAWISDRGGPRQVYVRREGQAARLLRDSPHPEVDLAWSPTQEHLAVVTGAGPDTAHILVVDGATGEVLHTLSDGEQALEHPAWSPDGLWIAMSCRRGESPSAICVASASGGPIRPVVSAPDTAVWLPRWPQG